MKQFFTLVSEGRGFELAEKIEPNQLLREYRSGDRPGVRFSATVYVHGKNRNHTRFDESELETFAASFKGQPFLADHSRKQADRGGTILDSVLEERDGKQVIRQTIDARKPWAVEGVLDGTVDRFSIGWNAEEYICTVCDLDFFDEDHKHSVFDVGTKDKKSGEIVEVLMKGVEGMEVSAVTHPAVPGTGTEGLLAQLSQLKETRASGKPGMKPGGTEDKQEDPMKEKVLSLLGLAADTAEPEALAALEKRLSAPSTPAPSLLTALGLGAEASNDEAIAKVYTLVPRSELEKALSTVAEAKAVDLVRSGKAAGKVTPAMEAWANEFARRDPVEFEKCLATMPVQVPPQFATPPAPAPDPKKIEKDEDAVRRSAGLSEDEWKRAKERVAALVN